MGQKNARQHSKQRGTHHTRKQEKMATNSLVQLQDAKRPMNEQDNFVTSTLNGHVQSNVIGTIELVPIEWPFGNVVRTEQNQVQQRLSLMVRVRVHGVGVRVHRARVTIHSSPNPCLTLALTLTRLGLCFFIGLGFIGLGGS